MNYLIEALIDPLSTDPDLFVNRTALLDRSYGRLAARLAMKSVSEAVLITGERGIGKSIFTRYLVRELSRNQERLITIELNGRSADRDRLLRESAIELWEQSGILYPQMPRWLEKWREELKALYTSRQLRKSDIQQINRNFGIGGEVSLLDGLGARFQWREERELGTVTDATTEVTDQLLFEALAKTTARLRKDGVRILAFYDNLDQAITADKSDRAGELLRQALGFGANLVLVHLRSEVVGTDVRREFGTVIDVGPLTPEELMRVVGRRLSRQDAETEAVVRAAEPAFDRLAHVAATPLAFLHWCRALFAVSEPPFNLEDEALRLELVRLASVSGLDAQLLLKFARVADRCMHGDALDPWCRRTDLLRGEGPILTGAPEKLSEEAVAGLERIGLIYPKERLADPPIYRVDPVLDLLRPSVVGRL